MAVPELPELWLKSFSFLNLRQNKALFLIVLENLKNKKSVNLHQVDLLLIADALIKVSKNMVMFYKTQVSLLSVGRFDQCILR
jgi:hypothetical protein